MENLQGFFRWCFWYEVKLNLEKSKVQEWLSCWPHCSHKLATCLITQDAIHPHLSLHYTLHKYTHYTLHKYTHYTVPETQCTLYLKQHSRHYTHVKHIEYKTHCALKSEHTKIPTFTQQCWLIVRWQEFKGGWVGTRDQHTDQSSPIHCLNTTHTKHYKVLWLYVAGCDSKRGRECANGTSLECDRSCSTWSVWRQFSLPSAQSMDNSPTPEVAEFNRLRWKLTMFYF